MRRAIALVVMGMLLAVAAAPVAAGQKPSAYERAAVEEKVDINSATVEELMKVPGMTAVWAKRIVRYRPYYTKRALLDQGILSSREYDRIKEFIIAHRAPKQK